MKAGTVKDVRKRLGMSFSDMAAALLMGKGPRAMKRWHDGGRLIRRWETGEREVSGGYRVALAFHTICDKETRERAMQLARQWEDEGHDL